MDKPIQLETGGKPWPDSKDIADWTDRYFNLSRGIVENFGDVRVTYAVFMRRPVVSAPRLMVEWLETIARERGTTFEIELNYIEGRWVGAGEPIAYVSGSFKFLVELETLFLQKLGAACVAAYNAFTICVDLPNVEFLAFDARHCAGTEMAELMAYAASVGRPGPATRPVRGALSATQPTPRHIISAAKAAWAPCRTRSSAMPARRCGPRKCFTKPTPTPP